MLQWRGFFLCRAGHTERCLEEYELAAQLDPGNPAIVGSWERELWALRRPLEALEVVRAYNPRQIEALDFGDLEFAFTGRTERLRSELDASFKETAPDQRLLAGFDLLRFERRFAELDAVLAFVEQQTPTPHDAWHLLMLEAEGALFLGDHERAVERARSAPLQDATRVRFRHDALDDRVRRRAARLAVRQACRSSSSSAAALIALERIAVY